MEVVIFILVIVALIVVHEFGHFVVAKLSRMRVDEFGLGYPPRIFGVKLGETEYTLNWLPFGGFVKIYGENSEQVKTDDARPRSGRAFTDKNRFLQALVLIAGITMNLIFAYVLITGALVAGTPRALAPDEVAHAKNAQLAVADVLPNSPAASAGLMIGDAIVRADDAEGSWSATDPASFSDFVSKSNGDKVTLAVERNNQLFSLEATPAAGLVSSNPSRYAIGVEVATIGVVPLSFSQAIVQGAYLTWGATVATAEGLAHFFASIFTLTANLSQVSGPVGIAQAVGSASASGFGDLLSIMALISINLALINLIPIPALDGGRLLFVIIEAITRRPIKPVISQAVNGIGFAFLILLMAVVTIHDIYKIVT
jgi:regulator of sigma E protease